jgi:hypothetical protein
MNLSWPCWIDLSIQEPRVGLEKSKAVPNLKEILVVPLQFGNPFLLMLRRRMRLLAKDLGSTRGCIRSISGGTRISKRGDGESLRVGSIRSEPDYRIVGYSIIFYIVIPIARLPII